MPNQMPSVQECNHRANIENVLFSERYLRANYQFISKCKIFRHFAATAGKLPQVQPCLHLKSGLADVSPTEENAL
jgi:hypothetical protein